MGSHSLFHPCCKRDLRNPTWLPDHYDLRDYTPERWHDEMRVADFALSLVDGESERSFGNTCCNTEISIQWLIAPPQVVSCTEAATPIGVRWHITPRTGA